MWLVLALMEVVVGGHYMEFEEVVHACEVLVKLLAMVVQYLHEDGHQLE